MRRISTPSELGRVFQDRRKKRKLTQGSVAEAIGMRQASISDFERRSASSQIETLFKIAAALDLDIYVDDKPVMIQEKGDAW